MTDQTVKELEKMGIKQPRHKAWDRCDCEDCTAYKLKLEIFQKGRDEAIRETLDRIEKKNLRSEGNGIWITEDDYQSLRRELLKGVKK